MTAERYDNKHGEGRHTYNYTMPKKIIKNNSLRILFIPLY